jgi:hypothetical protein
MLGNTHKHLQTEVRLVVHHCRLVRQLFFGAAGGSSLRGDESGSPLSAAQYIHQAISIDEGSEDGEEQKARRKKWCKEQNLQLVGAWLKHSTDPIHGNNKKTYHYWKKVTHEFNKYSCKAERRTIVQCKNHWNMTSTMVAKFNAALLTMRRVHVSGQSDLVLQLEQRATNNIAIKEEKLQK